MSDPGPTPPNYGQQPAYPAPPTAPYGWAPVAPTDRGAQTAMIVGIVAMALGFVMAGLGFLGSPVALVMGVRAKRRIDASGGALAGRGNAQAGFILGLIGTILLVLWIAAFIGLIALLFASDSGGTFVVTNGTPA